MNPKNKLDELLDIVDEHDQVVDTVWRSKSCDVQYLRVVLAFLRYQDGSVCFLRRTAHKEVFPSCLSVVGGCVSAGETYEEAFKREVLEEVSIDVTQHEYRLLGVVHPHEVMPGRMFKAIYEVTVNDLHVPFNTDDFSEYVWVQPDTFLKDVALHDSVAPDLSYLLQRFYLNVPSNMQ